MNTLFLYLATLPHVAIVVTCSVVSKIKACASQCRHINYERLDAFLCVECGYCAFGEFSFRLRSESAPDALDITNKTELDAARERLAGYAGAVRDAHQALHRLLPDAARLSRSCASMDVGSVFFPVGYCTPQQSRSALVGNLVTPHVELAAGDSSPDLFSCHAPPALQQSAGLSKGSETSPWLRNGNSFVGRSGALDFAKLNITGVPSSLPADNGNTKRAGSSLGLEQQVAQIQPGGCGLPLPLLCGKADTSQRRTPDSGRTARGTKLNPCRAISNAGVGNGDSNLRLNARIGKRQTCEEESRKFYVELDDAAKASASLVRAHGRVLTHISSHDDPVWGAVDAASCALVAALDSRSFATPKFSAELAADTGSLVARTMLAQNTLAALFDRHQGNDGLNVLSDIIACYHGAPGRFRERQHRGNWIPPTFGISSGHASRTATRNGDEDEDDVYLPNLRASLRRLHTRRGLNLSRTRGALSADDNNDPLIRLAHRGQLDQQQSFRLDAEDRQRASRSTLWSAASNADVSTSFAAAFSAAQRHTAEGRPSRSAVRQVGIGVPTTNAGSQQQITHSAQILRRRRRDESDTQEVDDAPQFSRRRRTSQPTVSRASHLDPVSQNVLDEAIATARIENAALLFSTSGMGGHDELVEDSPMTGRARDHRRHANESAPVSTRNDTSGEDDSGFLFVDAILGGNEESSVGSMPVTSSSFRRQHLSPFKELAMGGYRRRVGRWSHRYTDSLLPDGDDDSLLSRLLRERGASSEDDEADLGAEDDAHENLDVCRESDVENGNRENSYQICNNEYHGAQYSMAQIEPEDRECDEYPDHDGEDDGEDEDGRAEPLCRAGIHERAGGMDDEELQNCDNSNAYAKQGDVVDRVGLSEIALESGSTHDHNRPGEVLRDSVHDGNRVQPLGEHELLHVAEAVASSAKKQSNSRRSALEKMISLMHKRRILSQLGVLTNASVCTMNPNASYPSSNSVSTPNPHLPGDGNSLYSPLESSQCSELVDMYVGACGPLRRNLQHAMRKATETAARIRKHQKKDRKFKQPEGQHVEGELDTTADLLHQSTCATLVALTRLINLGGTLASVDYSELLTRRGFADALLTALTCTLQRDSKAFHAAGVALRTLCANSQHALQKTHAALCDLHGCSKFILDDDGKARRRLAMYVTLRDFLCAPPPLSHQGEETAWKAHVALAAHRARDLAIAASKSQSLSEEVLRPCLAVLCRLVGSRVFRQGETGETVSADFSIATDVLAWIRAELRRSTSAWMNAIWMTPDQARAVLCVHRAFKRWARYAPEAATSRRESACATVGSLADIVAKDGPKFGTFSHNNSCWLMAAANNPSCHAVRRQAVLLIAAAVCQPMNTRACEKVSECEKYACLEAACSIVMEQAPSNQLLAVLTELTVGGDAATKEYLRNRGFGRFCCLLIRNQARRLLRQDTMYVASTAGGSDVTAAAVAARSSPDLVALASIAASLAPKGNQKDSQGIKRARLATSRVGSSSASGDEDGNWGSHALLAIDRARAEELDVPLEASLILRELMLLRSRETDMVADVLSRIALAPISGREKTRLEDQSNRFSRAGQDACAVHPLSADDRLAFLAAATMTLKRRVASTLAPSVLRNESEGILDRSVTRSRHLLAGVVPYAEVERRCHCAGESSGYCTLAEGLSSTSLELLLELMSAASCPRQIKPHVALQLRRAPTQDEFFRGNLPRSSVSIDDIPRSRGRNRSSSAQQSDEDDLDDSDNEPTMADLRRKIAVDLDMADAAEMLELVVCDCIVALHLPIRQVHSKLWVQRTRAAAAARSRRQAAMGAFGLGSSNTDPSANLHDEDEEEDGDEDDEDVPVPDDDDDDDGPQGEEVVPMDEDDDEADDEYDIATHAREQRQLSASDTSSYADIVLLGQGRGMRGQSTSGSHQNGDGAVVNSIPTSSTGRRRRQGSTEEDVAPAMTVTYRLIGVDGEATEERIETLGDGSDLRTSRVSDHYGATTAIVEAGGLDHLVTIVAESDDDAVAARALALLRQCAMIENHATILAKMGAPAALLARLVRALRRGTERSPHQCVRSDRDVERLLGLLERLAPAMRDVTTTLEAPKGQTTHLETLVDGLRDARVAAALERTPALRRAVCRLLPALACGRRHAADALATRMTAWMRRAEDWVRCFDNAISCASIVDQPLTTMPSDPAIVTSGGLGDTTMIESTTGASALDLVEASCLRETAELLGGDDGDGFSDASGSASQKALANSLVAGADELGDALARNGFIAAATRVLYERVPRSAPLLPWSPACDSDVEARPRGSQTEWKAALETPGARAAVIASLRALRGACVASRRCAIVAFEEGAVHIAHCLDQLSFKSMRDVGLAAEALLDAVETGDDCAAYAVQQARNLARRHRRVYAERRRERQLAKLGLIQASGTLQNAISTRSGEARTDVINEELDPVSNCARCVVCREGIQSRPRDVLGAYVYVKLAVPDVGDADGAFLLAFGAPDLTAASSPSRIANVEIVSSTSRIQRPQSRGTSGAQSSSSSPQRRRSAQRRYSLISSVSAFNVIHMSCHREATRAERNMRSPRAEWDGATLRNSRVLCNSIIPLRPPVLYSQINLAQDKDASGRDKKPNQSSSVASDAAAAAAAYAAAVDKHFSSLTQFGVSSRMSCTSASSTGISSSSTSNDAPSRFTIIAHDVRLLLLRLAHGEPLHTESGGGSRLSNMLLVCYLMQLGAHFLTPRSEGGAATDNADLDMLRTIRRVFVNEALAHLTVRDNHKGKSNAPSPAPAAKGTGEGALTENDEISRHATCVEARASRVASMMRKVSECALRDEDLSDQQRRFEMLARLTDCAPHVALLAIFDDDSQVDIFDECKAVFATFAAYHALSRAESRAMTREQQRRAMVQSPTRNRAECAPENHVGNEDPEMSKSCGDSALNLTLDAQTQQRARTYTKSMLTYFALLCRMKQEFCFLAASSGERIPLLCGDDEAIAAAAGRVSFHFYD